MWAVISLYLYHSMICTRVQVLYVNRNFYTKNSRFILLKILKESFIMILWLSFFEPNSFLHITRGNANEGKYTNNTKWPMARRLPWE